MTALPVTPIDNDPATTDPTRRVRDTLARHPRGYSLPGPLYHDPALFAVEVEHIWNREWVFAGHAAEIRNPGDYITLTIGSAPLVVVRGLDGVVRALHNVCRHRGSIICEGTSGAVRRRFVCPYHQWSYELDGRLGRGRDMPEHVDPADLGLASAHCVDLAGLLFVCVAPVAPDIGDLEALADRYLGAFDLGSAEIAHQSTFVEHGNWKLVMENNRECFHCRTAHPELCRTFPEGRMHSGGGTPAEIQALDELAERCRHVGLPSRFMAAPDHGHRFMRMPFRDGAVAMTLDGTAAVHGRFGSLPDESLGDVLFYSYPSTWMHFMSDHAVTFRMLAVGPTTSELHTTWLVPEGSVAGRDYDFTRLTEVWEATNAQDSVLVERTQRGVRSPAYRPGPYAPMEEDGVIQFIDWYVGSIVPRLDADL